MGGNQVAMLSADGGLAVVSAAGSGRVVLLRAVGSAAVPEIQIQI